MPALRELIPYIRAKSRGGGSTHSVEAN